MNITIAECNIDDRPEQNLWRAVLIQAVRDVAGSNVAARSVAVNWFMAPANKNDREMVAHLAGQDMRTWQRAVARMVANPMTNAERKQLASP